MSLNPLYCKILVYENGLGGQSAGWSHPYSQVAYNDEMVGHPR